MGKPGARSSPAQPPQAARALPAAVPAPAAVAAQPQAVPFSLGQAATAVLACGSPARAATPSPRKPLRVADWQPGMSQPAPNQRMQLPGQAPSPPPAAGNAAAASPAAGASRPGSPDSCTSGTQLAWGGCSQAQSGSGSDRSLEGQARARQTRRAAKLVRPRPCQSLLACGPARQVLTVAPCLAETAGSRQARCGARAQAPQTTEPPPGQGLPLAAAAGRPVLHQSSPTCAEGEGAAGWTCSGTDWRARRRRAAPCGAIGASSPATASSARMRRQSPPRSPRCAAAFSRVQLPGSSLPTALACSIPVPVLPLPSVRVRSDCSCGSLPWQLCHASRTGSERAGGTGG